MRLRYAGLRNELAYDEPPGAAVVHLDIASATLDAPGDTEIVYGGGIGRGAQVRRPGYYSPSGNIEYAADIRTIGRLLRWALGGYVFTSQTPPTLNLHEFFGVNNVVLPSFCARLGKDLFEHTFSGCMVNSLEIAVEDEFATATMDVVAARDHRHALLAQSALLLPADFPLAFHEVTARIAGDATTEARVKSVTLSIANGVDAGAGRSLGSRFPRRMQAGEREVTLSMSLFFANTAELERLWGGTAGPVAEGATEFAISIIFNAGAAGTLTIAIPRAWYTSLSTQASGKDEIVQDASIRCLVSNIALNAPATIVQSELLATLRNAEGTIA